MKILHIGGLAPTTNALATAQAKAGHTVTVAHTWGGEYDFEAKDSQQETGTDVDLIHFHGFESLKHLDAETKARLVFSCGTEDPLSHAKGRELYGISDETFLQTFSHIFLEGGVCSDIPTITNAWSWLPLSVSLENIPAPPPREPKLHELTILHISYRMPKFETELISNLIGELQQGRFKFKYLSLSPDQIKEPLQIIFDRADVVIERIEGRSYGYLGVQAMAHGRAVLAHRSPTTWEPMTYCPILDLNPENFHKRLESILREPKCLRDLGKRSRWYIEQYHGSDVVAAKALEVYEQVLSSQFGETLIDRSASLPH